MPFTTLFVDFDGVIRHWPLDDVSIETTYGLPQGSIRRTAFAPELLLPAITGVISDEDWRRQVSAHLKRQYPGASTCEAVARWSAWLGELDMAVLDVLSGCRADMRLVLATNATSRLDRDLAALGLTKRFHAVANSSELGAAKPAERYFEAALQQAGVRAEAALFIDDSVSHVRAATAVGMRAHHYTDCAEMANFLSEAGVLVTTLRA